jgi:murein tripeptide amidase MpaA
MRYLTLLVVLGFLLTGCSMGNASGEKTEKQIESKELSTKEKQKVIIDYINKDIKKVSDLETEAYQSLSSVSGENFTDDNTMLAEIDNKALPAYEHAVKEAKNLKPKIKELEAPTQQIVKTTETFLEALRLQKEALEKQDKQLMEEANKKMLEHQSLLEKYHAEMGKLAKKYDVDYEPNRMN